MSKEEYVQLTIRVPETSREAAAALLWELDSLGFEETSQESQTLQIKAYFSASVPPRIMERAFQQLVQSAQVPVLDYALGGVFCDSEEWIRSYSESFTAFPVGDLFFIYPGWDKPSQRYPVNILLEPGHGFGTGTHESTQLVMLALGAIAREGKTLMDVGTGSGILSIAASKLNPDLAITACDIDRLALESAVANFRKNQIEGVSFYQGGPEAAASGFDSVLANLTAGLLQSLKDQLIRLAGRNLIVSGFTVDQKPLVLEAFCGNPGLRVKKELETNGWVCLHFEKWQQF